MSLLNYWPSAKEVNQCIKPEAEGVHDSVLLAVHQPSPLTYRVGTSGERIKTTEDELYNYFITPDVPTGAHIVPITGASGVGKSHQVRLLAARLQSDSANNFVVIRIPKSASLRRVVELILEPLPDTGYAKVKQEFKQALAEVNIGTAAINFQAQLEIALGDLEKDIKEQLIANPTNQLLKQQLGHARSLPRLMSDPVVVDHFRKNVLPRVVKRAVEGYHDDENASSQLHDFKYEDFKLPDNIDLSSAAKSTIMYYQTIHMQSGAGVHAIIDILNGHVVDQAVRQLFQLHEALGGMTLQDVILEIRKLLLKDHRELVILVEDFKALTGIQETLLNVLIQEGIRDGVRQYATMRSAIAVTDGYLAEKDTIATRAKREWFVESELDNETEVLGRTMRLVASYLNAARWGEDELRQHYAQVGNNWLSNQNWIGPYIDPEEQNNDDLQSFGYLDNIPLFPFSPLAIQRLAYTELTQGGKLLFTPRFVIDRILRNILLSGRDAFSENRFPPVNLKITPSSYEVAQWLSTLPESQRIRYERIVSIWGNAPKNRNDIGIINPNIFKVFGLNAPNIEAPISPTPPPIAGAPVPPVRVSTPITDLQKALESWVQEGGLLDQSFANQIRSSLTTAINDRIDWNGERCLKLPINSNQISIPNSKGQGNLSKNAIKISEDNRDADGRLRAELISLVRFYHHNRRQMDYHEVDDDLVYIGNLVSRLMPFALSIIRLETEIRLQNAIKLLTTNSRMLGLVNRYRTISAVSDFLFGSVTLPEEPSNNAHKYFLEWRELQNDALAIRPQLMDLLLSSAGCFQGIAKTTYGIDIIRIVDNYNKTPDKADLSVFESLQQDFKAKLLSMIESKVNVRAKRVLEEANKIRDVLVVEFGVVFEKQIIVDALKSLADALRGNWNQDEIGQSLTSFKNLCDDFRKSALIDTLEKLKLSAEFDDTKNENNELSRIAQLDINPLIVAQSFISFSKRVISSAQRYVASREGETRGVDPKARVLEIQEVFTSVLDDIEVLESKGEK